MPYKTREPLKRFRRVKHSKLAQVVLNLAGKPSFKWAGSKANLKWFKAKFSKDYWS